MVAWDGLNILVQLDVPKKKCCGSANRKNRIFLRFLGDFGRFLQLESLVLAEIACDGSLGWFEHTSTAKCAEKYIAVRQTAKTA